MGILAKSLAATAVAWVVLIPNASAAQHYDPATQTPRSLLDTPKDPVVYHDAKRALQALMEKEMFADAEPLAEQVARDYPRDGENWMVLGEVKIELGKYREAANAFERAGTLLWLGGGTPARSAASAHIRAGNRKAALDQLRLHASRSANMDRSGIYDRDEFKVLRSDPEFLKIVGRPDPTGWSRDDGWQHDLAFLRDEIRRLNPDYRSAPLPADFERRYQSLRQAVPQLSDAQIFVRMNELLAPFRQGHTAIWTTKDSRIPFRGLPFQLWMFPEGLFIVDAADGYKDLIGSRLLGVGDTDAEEAMRRINRLQSVDGDNEYLYLGVESLAETPFLAGLGLTGSVDAVRITVQKAGGKPRTLQVASQTTRFANRLMPLKGKEPPLYLRDLNQRNWQQPLPAHDALYLRVNLYDPDQSKHAVRLREILAERRPRNLILDLRFNDGGSTRLYAELLRTLVGYSLVPGNRLYTLIGRNTYSAAGNLVTELEQLANATFVGEASSECCTLYANPSSFVLPYSKLKGRMATMRVNLSRKGYDFRRELNPHAPVVLTADDYFSGRDPVLETVYRLIERERAAPPAQRPS